MKKLMNVQQVSEYLNISKSTVYHWIKTTKLKATKSTKGYLIKLEDVSPIQAQGKIKEDQFIVFEEKLNSIEKCLKYLLEEVRNIKSSTNTDIKYPDKHVHANTEYLNKTKEKYSIKKSSLNQTIMYLDILFYENLVLYTKKFPYVECGGILLTHHQKNEITCIAAIFPKQLYQSPVYCEFGGDDIVKIRSAINNVVEYFPNFNFTQIDWIHTHPNLGIFFSEKDKHTFLSWAKYNPNALAIVLDPFSKKSIEGYNTSLEEVSTRICDIQLTEKDKQALEILINDTIKKEMTIITPFCS